ncbi:hypothetical protein Pelo_17044 [Pelomyxa schiedti]|nr:hypothetical protein Pelo_17044 [Pelomyxa schiedti]
MRKADCVQSRTKKDNQGTDANSTGSKSISGGDEPPPENNWSFETDEGWTRNAIMVLLAGSHPRCGAGSPARPLCACPHLVRLVVGRWLAAVAGPRAVLVLEFGAQRSPGIPRGISRFPPPRKETVAFIAEVGCCGSGCVGVIDGCGPRVCQPECKWIDARMQWSCVGYMGEASVVDSVTGRKVGLGVWGIVSAECNGHWAVMRSVWGRAWVWPARVRFCSDGDHVVFTGESVEVSGMGPQEFVSSERFVSENVMSVVSRVIGVSLICKLVDVQKSFAAHHWVILDSMTVLEDSDTDIKQVSWCWEKRVSVGVKAHKRSWENILFTTDPSGAIHTIPTDPKSTITILDSFLVIQAPPTDHPVQKLEKEVQEEVVRGHRSDDDVASIVGDAIKNLRRSADDAEKSGNGGDG